MTTLETLRAHADAAALRHDAVLAATSVPQLLQSLINLTAAITTATDEDAADVLRVRRVQVSAELERRCGS